MISGDEVTVNVAVPPGVFPDKNVDFGNYKYITHTGISLYGADAGNYYISPTARGRINPRPVTIRVVNVNGVVSGAIYASSGRDYDGTTTAPFDLYSNMYYALDYAENNVVDTDGWIYGDNLTIVRGTANYADKHVGYDKPVTFSGFSLGGTDAGNYELVSQPPSATSTITPKPLYLYFPNLNGTSCVASKYYDGTTTATYTNDVDRLPVQLYYGRYLIVGDDEVILNAPSSYRSISVRFATKDFKDYASWDPTVVIQGKRITLGSQGCSISGADAHNYLLRTEQTYEVNDVFIWPPQVTVSGTIPTKTFDGNPPDLSGLSIVGKNAGDDVSIRYKPGDDILDWWPEYAGTYTVRVGLGGADAGNYSLTGTTTVTQTINPKSITITASVPSSKGYDGRTTATISSASANGTVNGEDAYIRNGSANYDTPDVGTNKLVTFSGFWIANSNYTLSGQPPSVRANIDRGTPSIYWPPHIGGTESQYGVIAAFYGQTLANIPIPNNMGGAYTSAFGSVPGTFTWTTPGSSVGGVGKHSHNMTFIPNDTATWNTVTADVPVYVIAKPEMVYVPGGSFQMGDDSYDNKKPAHTVTLSSFYISQDIIKINQHARVNSNEYIFSFNTQFYYYGRGLAAIQSRLDDIFFDLDAYYRRITSMTDVIVYRREVEDRFSFASAVVYCNNLSTIEGLTPVYTINGTTVTADFTQNGYRLPTEAEWDYVFSSSVPLDFYTYTYEWVWDWYGPYSAGAQTNPTGPASGSYRVMRNQVYRAEGVPEYNIIDSYLFRIVRNVP